jgi:hypothetical protein
MASGGAKTGRRNVTGFSDRLAVVAIPALWQRALGYSDLAGARTARCAP